MARTKGSGWGGGVMYYQICPFCGRKKALYNAMDKISSFKCIWCKEYFESDQLLRIQFKSQLKNQQNKTSCKKKTLH